MVGVSEIIGAPRVFFEYFDSKPYINPTKTPTNSVYINWNTVNPDSTIVVYGLTPAITDTVRGSGVEYYHHTLLQNLLPDTIYYYRVLPNGNLNTFRTFAATTDSFYFIVYGDTRTDSVAHQSVIDRMLDYPSEFIVHSGDLVGTGDNTVDWRIFFNTTDTILQSKLFLPSIGNHEYPFWPYDTLFVLPDSENYYSVDYANCHFIVLNTEMNLSGVQKTWMISDLSSASANPGIAWIIAIFHRPPYSSGLGHGSQLDVRNEWCPVFEQYGVDIAFSGHDHIYERTIPINNVVYIVTGGGGAPLHAVVDSPWTACAQSTYHFCWLKIKDKRLELYAIKPDGTIFDSLIIEKESGIESYKEEKPIDLSIAPNPFRRQVSIIIHNTEAEIEERNLFRLHPSGISIYNAMGKCIKVLPGPDHISHYGNSRVSVFIWSGEDEYGNGMPSGVYFIRLNNQKETLTEKVVILR